MSQRIKFLRIHSNPAYYESMHRRRYPAINIDGIWRESFCQCTLEHCALVVSPVRRLHGVYKEPASCEKWGSAKVHFLERLRETEQRSTKLTFTKANDRWAVIMSVAQNNVQVISQILINVSELNYFTNLRRLETMSGAFPNFPLTSNWVTVSQNTKRQNIRTSSLHQQLGNSTLFGNFGRVFAPGFDRIKESPS